MNEREKIIRLWFDMWLKQQDLGMDKIFTEDVVYTESWCPKYENLKTVKHWFNEWNTRGKVIIWDLVFFHSTYNAGSYVTHVGIYVGNNQMYHAGDPIGYADLSSSYWQQHLIGAGRVKQ